MAKESMLAEALRAQGKDIKEPGAPMPPSEVGLPTYNREEHLKTQALRDADALTPGDFRAKYGDDPEKFLARKK